MKLQPLATKFLLLATTVSAIGFRFPLVRHPHVANNFTFMGVHEANATDWQVEGDWKTDGSYYVSVKVGMQELALFLDTGSSDIGVSAKGCHGCTKKYHHPYDPLQSKATPLGCDWCTLHKGLDTELHCKKRPQVKEKQCTIMQHYADDSGFSAALWEDTITILGSKELTTRGVVGAIYEAKFPNAKTVDGIIGLADQSESVAGAPNFIDGLVADGTIDNVFTMCLNYEGGHIYLGLDHKLQEQELHDEQKFLDGLYGYGEDMKWTPRVNGSGFYGVTVTDVLVNDKKLPVPASTWNNGTVIIDSGTSDSTLPKFGLEALKHAFEDLCFNETMCLKGTCDCKEHEPLGRGIWESRCVQMSPSELKAYPTITFVMEGDVHVEMPPELYVVSSPIWCENGAYTITFGRGDNGDGTILGANLMQGYMIAHDRREESKRMGFAKIKRGECPF